MKKQTFNGVLAFSAGHARAIVFMCLGFNEREAIDLALGKLQEGEL